jgi:hypothetical protein
MRRIYKIYVSSHCILQGRLGKYLKICLIESADTEIEELEVKSKIYLYPSSIL